MTSNILFIDANVYLDLYTLVNGKQVSKILTPLQGFKSKILITEQIADEVNRNKLNMVAALFKSQLQHLTLNDFVFPDHLFGMSEKESKKINDSLEKLKQDTKGTKQDLLRKATATLEKVSTSEDVISKRLNHLFKDALKPSEEELFRAKSRKEYGNPPGKKGDPLGDQLSWEQVLTYCKNKVKNIWIITRDEDFFTQFDGQIFLNPILRNDLVQCGVKEIYCFADLLEGIKNFSDKTGEQKDKIPTEKEADKLRQSINQVTINNTFDLLKSVNSSGILREAQKTVTSYGDLSKAYAEMEKVSGSGILREAQRTITGYGNLSKAYAEMEKVSGSGILREAQKTLASTDSLSKSVAKAYRTPKKN